MPSGLKPSTELNVNSTFSDPFFLPYQTAWRRDPSRLKICQKSRQIGLTYVDSYDSVTKAALAGGRDVWVMSRDEAQAKQYIRYCKRWATVLDLAADELGELVYTDANGKAAKIQVLTFASGFGIYALSSNPDAIVGKTGHVKLDEFALHKDQRTLYAVAKPVIQWGGTLSIISTHRGIGTVFNEIITDIREAGNRMGWSLHTIPIQTAVEQAWSKKSTQPRRHARNFPSRTHASL
jgi:phage FluMu gp28-like protein